MPGGKIAPDGRQPAPPGVGKTARRHDLEAPATPGLHDSDLQQGDVQRLEQAQKIAPRAKRVQPPAQGGGAPRNRPQRNTRGAPTSADVPDPVAMATQRRGGNIASGNVDNASEPLDVEKWSPLLREIARNPKVSGPLTTTIMAQLSNIASLPSTSSVRVIDQNAADVALRESL